MSAVWKQATKSGNWSTTFRGIGVVIKVDATGRPKEIQWFVAGKMDESSPVSCGLSEAQEIAIEVIERLMPDTPHWQAAELREIRDSLLRR